jgi:hypothetical protein
MWTTLAFVPFTGLHVVDIGITTIVGFQFFGVLFILRCLIDDVWSEKRGLKVSKANGLAALFLFVCFSSMSMAILKAGTVEVYTETQGRWTDIVSNSGPLRLSSFNFTQVLYPTFGVLLFHFLVRELRSPADLKKTVNILVWGALITAGFSVAAGILFTLGQGNTYWGVLNLFTAGPLAGVGSPQISSVGEFVRTYTPAGEPGFTAMTLLLGLGLVVGSMVRRQMGSTPLIRAPRLKLSALALALFFNGSTTGYFGGALLIAWGVVAPWYIGGRGVHSLRPLLYAAGGVAAVAVAGTMIQVSGISFYEWVTEYHLAKVQGESGSGQIRAYVTWYSLTEVFLASPLLGVGYGSHLSLSLVTFLLANVGLVGFGVFLMFLFVVFRNATTAARKARGPLGTVAFASVLLFVPFFATLFVAKATSGMNYGATWTVIALAEAAYQVYRRQLTHQAV